MILDREGLFGRAAAHLAARAVAARAERVGVAEPAHDERFHAHGTRDDAELAGARAHRALARDQHVGAEMRLPGQVVVMAVDGGFVDGEIRQRLRHGAQDRPHHQLAVRQREILRPAHGPDVVVEQLRAFDQVGQVLVRQVNEPALHFLLGALDEIGPDAVADAARAGMQHGPDPVALVQADLDEVVAGAERAQVACVVGREGLGMVLDDRLVARLEPGPGPGRSLGH